MAKIKLSNLELLADDMETKGEFRATFPYEYNGKAFSCIFIKDIVPYRLYLTTLGTNPLVFEFEVDAKTYEISGYIEKYKELVKYLDIKYDPNHKFMPNDFLNNLNMHIPAVFNKKPNYSDTLKVAAHTRKIEEIDKSFFCGWRKNPSGSKVRKENYEKTKSAFGDKKAHFPFGI